MWYHKRNLYNHNIKEIFMRFDLDMGDDEANKILAYEPGKVTINDEIFTSSVIVTPSHILPWPITNISTLTRDDLQQFFELKPEIVIIGSGEKLEFLPQHFIFEFHRQKIGLEIMTTAAACRTYDVLMAEGRNVLVALIL